MIELIELGKIEKELKASLEEDLKTQREVIINIAKRIDDAIKLKQLEVSSEIVDELKLLKKEFKTYQKKYEQGTREYSFYEGSLNGVSSSIDRVLNLK